MLSLCPVPVQFFQQESSMLLLRFLHDSFFLYPYAFPDDSFLIYPYALDMKTT